MKLNKFIYNFLINFNEIRLKKYTFLKPRPDQDLAKNGVWVVLAFHLLVWVTAHWITDTNLDGYGDMLENYAWGQDFSWGSTKHPPLFAWVTGIWFTVFPNIDTAYHLLSYTNVVVGLLGVYRLATALDRHDLALPAIILLSMGFPYSTLAVKFNANAILLSIWPWVTVAWVQSIRITGRNGFFWSVGLGVLAALAMLGKYYSGVLLLSLFLTALTFSKGRRWFSTSKPWISLLVGGVALVPHWNWLQSHQFITLHYLSEQGGQEGANWPMLFKFAVAPIAYWLIPWLLCTGLLFQTGDSWTRILRTWPLRMIQSWRPNGWGDSLFWLAMLPWALTLMFGASGFVELSMPWAIPIGFGFSLLWLRNLAPDADNLLLAIRRLMWALKIWWLLVLLASPWYAWYQAQQGTVNYYLPRREAAQALLQTWQLRHPDVALQWVGGQWAENALLAFYGDAKIRVVPGVPDQYPATVNPLTDWKYRAGLLLCPLGPGQADNAVEAECPKRMRVWLQAHEQGMEPITITLNREGLRFPLNKPFSYMVFEYLPVKP